MKEKRKKGRREDGGKVIYIRKRDVRGKRKKKEMKSWNEDKGKRR